MKKTRNFIAVLLAAIPLAVSAQVNETPLNASGNLIRPLRPGEAAPQGSMFINENYTAALQESSGVKLMLRYNAYMDEFEMKNPQTNEVSSLSKIKGDRLTFNSGQSVYVYTPYFDASAKPIMGYLSILTETTGATVYKREKIIVQPGTENNNSYNAARPAQYKKAKDEFYIKIKDENIVKLPSNKKDFAKLFPGKDKEVLDYLKQNRIDLENQKDLVKLDQLFKTIL